MCACSDNIILSKCLESKRFECHICHAGLLDAAMPIIKNGILAGIVLMGRLRRSGDRSKTDSLSPTLAKKYVAVPEFNDSQIESLRSLLPNVLFESAIFLEYDGGFDEIVEYIKANLREPLRIDHICKKFHISKNSLYAHFKETYGKTVNEFIVDERMNMASQLLLNGSEPIYIVAESVGIDNHTYFCKIFKKRNGITPNQYRKSK
jgi:AraC-like DNA-binding protein